MLDPIVIEVVPEGDSPAQVALFRLTVGDRLERTMVIPLVRLDWEVRAWAWETDPLEDRDAWRAEVDGVEPVPMASLDLPFGYSGPSGVSERLSAVDASERFGLIAETSVVLPAGSWSVQTLSDDGVRVAEAFSDPVARLKTDTNYKVLCKMRFTSVLCGIEF